MKVGFIALGKLGFPCSVAAAQRGHEVWGYDVSERINTAIRANDPGAFSYEPSINYAYSQVKDRYHLATSLQEVVDNSEILFLSPQTPHPQELDGSWPFRHARKDFDYNYLVKCVHELAGCIKDYRVVVIVSTVLPGTIATRVLPVMERLLGSPADFTWDLIYSPSFIAQGTVVKDFVAPEFTLCGGGHSRSHKVYREYLLKLHSAPLLKMSIESAELTKVIYNTAIGLKIALANTVMELCETSPTADCDSVMGALAQATDRITSSKYLRAGMGDGGGCHPRDNIAMAYISDRAHLKYNLFDFMMTARDHHTRWLLDRFLKWDGDSFQQYVVLGSVFKPGVDQEVGSPGLLLARMLEEHASKPVFIYDTITRRDPPPTVKSLYFLALDDPEYLKFNFVPGSVIIDPWGMLNNKALRGCRVVTPGRK